MMKWYERVDREKPAVISSRIRLVRNWNQYVFPSRLTPDAGEEMIRQLKYGLRELGTADGRDYEYEDLQKLSELDKKALRERRVINSTIAAKKAPAGLILSEEEDAGIVLNGTDHIRIQLLSAGMHLEELWKQADRIDDFINEKFEYAFDEKYGYLTSFPTNVGTGLRAAVVLHLPMLSKNKNFSSLVADMGRFGTQVRGVYGEGAENFGSLYQISNQKTLGQTEQEIIDIVRKAALELDAQERRMRREYRQRKPVQAADECYKSYGVLKYARRLTRKDGMEFLSQIMTGITDGILTVKEPCSVYGLMIGIQPANLLSLADRPLDKDELDAARAEFLRKRLPEIIEPEA